MTTRRTLLRGMGVTMALPWLESIPVWGASTETYPKRLAVLFMGNGVNGNHWWAKGAGAEMKLSKTLSPLEPLKSKINVIHGLFHKRATGQGIHPAQTGCLLSGATIQKGAIIKAGVTVDQMIANRLGQDNAQQSIVLACEQPMTGYHETNYSMAYSSHTWGLFDVAPSNRAAADRSWLRRAAIPEQPPAVEGSLRRARA